VTMATLLCKLNSFMGLLGGLARFFKKSSLPARIHLNCRACVSENRAWIEFKPLF